MNDVPWPSRLTLHVVLAAWRSITLRQVATTFAFGCAFMLFDAFLTDLDPFDVLHELVGLGVRDAVQMIAIAEIKAFVLLGAFVLADLVTGNDPDRRRVYALAVIVGAVVGVAVAFSFLLIFLQGQWVPTVAIPKLIRRYLNLVLFGGAVFWLILDRRRARRSRATMHAAELDRIAAEKRSIESDLQAMQARVEPQFLFSTLAQVKGLYERDAAAGEQMLDELIAYLHAAMPKMRDTASTLGQEIELLRAYLAIVKVRLGDQFTYVVEGPPDADSIRMPSMMLLPLLDHAVGRVSLESRARSMAIRCRVNDVRTRVDVEDSVDGFLPGNDNAAIVGVRERLRALYGLRASLVVKRREGGTEAVLEFPLEPLSQAAARSSVLRPTAEREERQHESV